MALPFIALALWMFKRAWHLPTCILPLWNLTMESQIKLIIFLSLNYLFYSPLMTKYSNITPYTAPWIQSWKLILSMIQSTTLCCQMILLTIWVHVRTMLPHSLKLEKFFFDTPDVDAPRRVTVGSRAEPLPNNLKFVSSKEYSYDALSYTLLRMKSGKV